MKKAGVYVIGAGGHAKVIVATLRDLQIQIEGLFDDDPQKQNTKVLGIPVLGKREDALRFKNQPAILGIGHNATRKEISLQLAFDWITLVHPTAHVDLTAKLERGVFVAAGAVIQPDVQLGEHSIVNTSASVDHDSRIGSFVHIAPGAHLGGTVSIGTGSLIGIGSAVIPGIQIGEWSIVGAGSTVIQNLPSRITAIGSPAKASQRSLNV